MKTSEIKTGMILHNVHPQTGHVFAKVRVMGTVSVDGETWFRVTDDHWTLSDEVLINASLTWAVPAENLAPIEVEGTPGTTPGKDWIVRGVSLNGNGGLWVSGVNLCCPEGDAGRNFTWSLRPSSLDNPRYDLSGASWGPGAKELVQARPQS